MRFPAQNPTRAVATAAICLAALLGACASAGTAPREGSYTERMAKLTADCRAREGILTPTGLNEGRPEVDNACVIRGGTSTTFDH